ncbi:MAG TPA: PorT family protein, partial [Sphingobacteriaceae bacterium]|nr:PorT family protein [Sphingobacteriaceae bacterium]
MKKLLIVAVASLMGSAAFAQTSASATHFGLKAGINLPKYSFGQNDAANNETNTTVNFHVTGYLDAPLGSMFSIQPGISLQGKGGEFFDNGTTQVKQNTLWIEVPVNFVAKFPVSGTNFFLGAGPYAAAGIAGQNKLTTSGSSTESDVKFGDQSGDDLKGMDFGLNFLGGVQLNSG